MYPSCFPSTVPSPDGPLPYSPASGGPVRRLSLRYYETTTTPAWHSRRSVCSVAPDSLEVTSSLRSGPWASRHGPARMLMTGFSRSGRCPKDQDGSHRFPGCPHVPLPCSWTPVGPNAPHLYGALVLSPLTKARRLQHECISRLDHTASVLAVYASCRPLGRRRKTRFRWVVSLSGWDCITHWATAGSFGLSASPPSGLFLSRFVGNFVANFVDGDWNTWDFDKVSDEVSDKGKKRPFWDRL